MSARAKIIALGMILWVVILETIFYYNRYVYLTDTTAGSFLSGGTRDLKVYDKIGGGESMFGKYDLYERKDGGSIVVYHAL